MDEVLYAHTPNEVRYYLLVTSCEQCGGGPLIAKGFLPAESPGGAAPPARQAAVRTRCKRCRHQRTFHFRWERDVLAEPEHADCINPSPQPSRIIDLGQWVGLYALFADSTAAGDDAAQARANARQAALCLAEALKFHGEGELPPDSAFFCEASKAAYRANPANYARTRLRELQAMLPSPVRPDELEPPLPEVEDQSWWQRLLRR